MAVMFRSVKSLILSIMVLLLCTPCLAAGEKVVISDAPTLLTALVTIAKEKGFFDAAGLDVTIAKYATGDEATKALFTNKADVAIVAETAFVFDSFARQDFSVFAAIGSWDNEVKIIARKDRGIMAPSDLRGKRIATQEKISVHFFLDLFLLKHGMTEKDASISFIKGPELPKAIAAGEIDAFSHRNPFLGQASSMLGDNGVVLSAPGLYLKSFLLVSLNTFIKERPKTVEKLLNALLMAERYTRKNKNESIELISAQLKLPTQEIQGVWQEIDLRLTLDQHLLLTFEEVARWAIKSRFTDRTSVPNYLNFIHADALKVLRPHSVTVIK